MTQMLNFRASDEDMGILEAVRREGESTTAVLRRALRAAQVLSDREQMRRESAEVAADAEDLAEMREVQAEMSALNAW